MKISGTILGIFLIKILYRQLFFTVKKKWQSIGLITFIPLGFFEASTDNFSLMSLKVTEILIFSSCIFIV